MASFNKVILIGNLTADPELKQTPSGKSVCSFTLAVNRRSKDEPACDFINIVAWEKRADFVAPWFKKGKPMLVTGALQTRSWTDKEGNKRTAYEVLADEISFIAPMDAKENTAASVPETANRYIPEAYTNSAPQFEDLSGGEDLPF